MAPAIQSCAWTRGACGTNFASTTPIGTADPVVISLPKGSYVPAFEFIAGADSRPRRSISRRRERTARRSRPANRLRQSIAPTSARSRMSVWRGAALALGMAASFAGGYAALSSKSARPTAPTGRIMLAVLPFQNLTGDPEQEYLCDGLTEEMIAILGGVDSSRLGIIARTSAMHYKNTTKRADEIGRELGVGYLLETSLRRIGDRVSNHGAAHRGGDSRPRLGGTVRARRAGRPRAPTRGRRYGCTADDGEPWGAAAKSPFRHRSSVGQFPGLRALSPRALPLGQGNDRRTAQSARPLSEGHRARPVVRAGLQRPGRHLRTAGQLRHHADQRVSPAGARGGAQGGRAR